MDINGVHIPELDTHQGLNDPLISRLILQQVMINQALIIGICEHLGLDVPDVEDIPSEPTNIVYE